MTNRTRLACLAFLATSPAFAQSQSAMNTDAVRQARAADVALNARYTAAMARLSSPSRLLLRDAQRSWIAFRDRQCAFEASGVKGGSAYPMVYGGCLARVATDRTRDPRRLGQCQEGDLACPR